MSVAYSPKYKYICVAGTSIIMDLKGDLLLIFSCTGTGGSNDVLVQALTAQERDCSSLQREHNVAGVVFFFLARKVMQLEPSIVVCN